MRRHIQSGIRSCLITLMVLNAGCSFRDGHLHIRLPTIPAINTPVVVPDHKEPVIREFRCLIVEDERARSSLTSVQRRMLFGKELRDFLKENCAPVQGEDGVSHPGFMVLDKSQDLTGIWAELIKGVVPSRYPFIVATDGATNGSTYMETWDDVKNLLDKYAGVK